MNGSKKWGFVWWAVGDNAGRSTGSFLRTAGCPDLKVYTAREDGRIPWRTHDQGVPEELEGCPIISNARNPYAKAVSECADNNEDYFTETGKDLIFEEWVVEQFEHSNASEHMQSFGKEPWVEWEKVGYPNYHLRVEHLVEDMGKIKPIVDNAKKEDYNKAIKEHFETDIYVETRRMIGYKENGLLDWERFYNQKLADYVYDQVGRCFELTGYEKDSWKI